MGEAGSSAVWLTGGVLFVVRGESSGKRTGTQRRRPRIGILEIAHCVTIIGRVAAWRRGKTRSRVEERENEWLCGGANGRVEWRGVVS